MPLVSDKRQAAPKGPETVGARSWHGRRATDYSSLLKALTVNGLS
jgi:hypothetical protein